MDQDKTLHSERDIPGVVGELGELGSGAVINEDGLAKMFKRCNRTIQRAIERGELPQPTRLFGKRSWTAGVIIQHLEGRLEAEAKEQVRKNNKIREFSP